MSRPSYQQRGSRRNLRRMQMDRQTFVRTFWLVAGGAILLLLWFLSSLADHMKPH